MYSFLFFINKSLVIVPVRFPEPSITEPLLFPGLVGFVGMSLSSRISIVHEETLNKMLKTKALGCSFSYYLVLFYF